MEVTQKLPPNTLVEEAGVGITIDIPKPGKFIVVEGADGAGKSTFCKNLAEVMRKRYLINVVEDVEFTHGFVGQYIRKHFNDGTLPNGELQLLALLDRLHHMTKLDGVSQLTEYSYPAYTVVCDRGWMSTLAYALAVNDNDTHSERLKLLMYLTDLISIVSMSPHLTIFIDISEETARERIRKRGDAERFEDDETITKVHKAYHQLIELMKLNDPFNEYINFTDNFITIDGEDTETEMVAEACTKMEYLGMFTPFMKGDISDGHKLY